MDYLQLLHSTVRLAAPTILIAMGGLFSLKINVFNLALDSFALFGCFASVVGAYFTNSVFGGVCVGVLITIIMTMIYGVFVFEFKVDAVVCAVAFIILANGLTRYLMKPIFNVSGKYILSDSLALKPLHFSFLENIPVIGVVLNNHSVLVYLALITPFIIYILLYKTTLGLSLRAIGQNLDAAVSAGISAKRINYTALLLNGLFCGLAGAQLSLSLNLFNVGMTSGRGFTALAVLILTNSEPVLAFAAGLLFGFAEALSNVLSADGYPSQILGMLPYALALIAAILPMAIRVTVRKRKKHLSERKIIGIDR